MKEHRIVIELIVKTSDQVSSSELKTMTEVRDEYAKAFDTQSRLHSKFAREAESLKRERDTLRQSLAEWEAMAERLADDIVVLQFHHQPTSRHFCLDCYNISTKAIAAFNTFKAKGTKQAMKGNKD